MTEEYYLWKVKLTAEDDDDAEYGSWTTYLITETPKLEDFNKALNALLKDYADEGEYKLDAMKYIGLCIAPSEFKPVTTSTNKEQ